MILFPPALLYLTLFFQSQLPPQEILRDALRLQAAGDYEASAERFREVLKADTSLYAVHANLGFVLSKMGKFEEAAAEYREALRADPTNFDVALNLSLSLYKMGSFGQAAAQLQQLHAVQSENFQVTMLLADCWLRLGQNQNVIQLLRPVEQQGDENNLAVAYVLGTALIREKQVAEGQRLVDRILSKGESAEAHFLLGTQMAAAGDFPSAVGEFRHAAQLNPGLPSLQLAYGVSLLSTGDPDAARDAFRKELAVNPGDFEANLYLGEIEKERAHYASAEALLRRALQSRPDSLDARVDLGDLALRQKHYGQAQADLETLARQFPENVSVHETLAAAYGGTGDSRASRELEIAARLRHTTQASRTLAVGAKAPDFALPDLKSQKPIRLSELTSKSPMVLVLGSYTCPNFRQAAKALNEIYRQFGNRIPFYMVYIREAHADGSWQSGRNEREHVNLQKPTNMTEKAGHAALCVRKLKIDFPVMVDGMDGSVEASYAGWPSHAYIVGTDGRVAYSSGLTELEFHPAELQAALSRLEAKANHAGLAPHR